LKPQAHTSPVSVRRAVKCSPATVLGTMTSLPGLSSISRAAP